MGKRERESPHSPGRRGGDTPQTPQPHHPNKFFPKKSTLGPPLSDPLCYIVRMNTLTALIIGFVSALFYARGKADPVRAFLLDLKRLYRWGRAAWGNRGEWKKDISG